MADKIWILIVDDDKRMAKTLVDILRVKGFEAEAVHSGAEALDKIEEGYFDCVLTDIKMPGINGVELYREIKAKLPDLPVVLMTAYSSDKLVEKGLKEGAIASLTKPLDINSLLSFFSALRQERSVVIVDGDPEFSRTLSDILQGRGFAVTQILDIHTIEDRVQVAGQVVLLDMKLNHTDGLEILKRIRSKYRHLPVILVTGYRDEMAESIEAGLRINSYTCLYKPFHVDEHLTILSEVHRNKLSSFLGQPKHKHKRDAP